MASAQHATASAFNYTTSQRKPESSRGRLEERSWLPQTSSVYDKHTQLKLPSTKVYTNELHLVRKPQRRRGGPLSIRTGMWRFGRKQMLNHISGHKELSRCAPDSSVTSAEGLMSQRMEAAATEGGFKHSSSGRSRLIPSQAGLTTIERLFFRLFDFTVSSSALIQPT